MTGDAVVLLNEVLALPESDRASIAVELLASLGRSDDDPEAVAQAWAEELDRRADRYLSGQEPTEDWAAVRERILCDLKQR